MKKRTKQQIICFLGLSFCLLAMFFIVVGLGGPAADLMRIENSKDYITLSTMIFFFFSFICAMAFAALQLLIEHLKARLLALAQESD